jgi:hypothetical protein
MRFSEEEGCMMACFYFDGLYTMCQESYRNIFGVYRFQEDDGKNFKILLEN